ncbi:MAG: hypothetical protein AAFX09_11460 [Pseudomonadota bacterium]
MLRLIGETRSGLTGVAKLIAFRPDWKTHFDISGTGVARSFLAALVGLPAFVLIVAGANYFVAANPQLSAQDPDAGFTLVEAGVHYLRLWLVFPLAAALTVRLLGLQAAFGPWLVVHNWTVCMLLMLQGFFWALYAAGIADAGSLGAVLSFYTMARLLAHWRVAAGALDLGWGPAAAAAGIPVVLDYLTLLALEQVI